MMFLSSQLLVEKKVQSFAQNKSKGKNHLHQIIENLGYIQIDTISVVERSHHHVLWTRFPFYQKSMLDELLEGDKMIFEYWSHAASYLPIRDFRYSLIRKKHYYIRHKEWANANKSLIKYIYNRIKSEGPLQSRKFEDQRENPGGWWDWKPSKDVLNYLFHSGKLMIARRKGFQKVYDMTERVLPESIDTSFPTENQYYKHLILSAINSNGLASEKEITYLKKYNKTLFGKSIKELLEDKKIMEVGIRSIDKEIYLTSESNLKLMEDKKTHSDLHILSPFDNLIIQRKRLKNLFSYDYQIECYLPEAKRKFGYFCLPLLYKNKFIGKIDAKANRLRKVFEIKNIYWEEKIKLDEKLLTNLEDKLYDYAAFTGCDEVMGLRNKIKGVKVS